MKIEVKNVFKKFGDNLVLEDIDVEFEEGKIYGLIGKNGSGKSVFLKILCAFYEPSSGKVLYDGQDIFKERVFPKDTRSLIEKPCFLPDLSGRENLLLLASIQNKISEVEVDETLKKVGLYEDRNKKYHKYSLGMKQKLGIAQVLMEEPKVLILDEAFNGLDEESAQNIRSLLLEEKAKQKIIILATHMKEDIEMLCDDVYQIKNAKIEKISES